MSDQLDLHNAKIDFLASKGIVKRLPENKPKDLQEQDRARLKEAKAFGKLWISREQETELPGGSSEGSSLTRHTAAKPRNLHNITKESMLLSLKVLMRKEENSLLKLKIGGSSKVKENAPSTTLALATLKKLARLQGHVKEVVSEQVAEVAKKKDRSPLLRIGLRLKHHLLKKMKQVEAELRESRDELPLYCEKGHLLKSYSPVEGVDHNCTGCGTWTTKVSYLHWYTCSHHDCVAIKNFGSILCQSCAVKSVASPKGVQVDFHEHSLHPHAKPYFGPTNEKWTCNSASEAMRSWLEKNNIPLHASCKSRRAVGIEKAKMIGIECRQCHFEVCSQCLTLFQRHIEVRKQLSEKRLQFQDWLLDKLRLDITAFALNSSFNSGSSSEENTTDFLVEFFPSEGEKKLQGSSRVKMATSFQEAELIKNSTPEKIQDELFSSYIGQIKDRLSRFKLRIRPYLMQKEDIKEGAIPVRHSGPGFLKAEAQVLASELQVVQGIHRSNLQVLVAACFEQHEVNGTKFFAKVIKVYTTTNFALVNEIVIDIVPAAVAPKHLPPVQYLNFDLNLIFFMRRFPKMEDPPEGQTIDYLLEQDSGRGSMDVATPAGSFKLVKLDLLSMMEDYQTSSSQRIRPKNYITRLGPVLEVQSRPGLGFSPFFIEDDALPEFKLADSIPKYLIGRFLLWQTIEGAHYGKTATIYRLAPDFKSFSKVSSFTIHRTETQIPIWAASKIGHREGDDGKLESLAFLVFSQFYQKVTCNAVSGKSVHPAAASNQGLVSTVETWTQVIEPKASASLKSYGISRAASLDLHRFSSETRKYLITSLGGAFPLKQARPSLTLFDEVKSAFRRQLREKPLFKVVYDQVQMVLSTPRQRSVLSSLNEGALAIIEKQVQSYLKSSPLVRSEDFLPRLLVINDLDRTHCLFENPTSNEVEVFSISHPMPRVHRCLADPPKPTLASRFHQGLIYGSSSIHSFGSITKAPSYDKTELAHHLAHLGFKFTDADLHPSSLNLNSPKTSSQTPVLIEVQDGSSCKLKQCLLEWPASSFSLPQVEGVFYSLNYATVALRAQLLENSLNEQASGYITFFVRLPLSMIKDQPSCFTLDLTEEDLIVVTSPSSVTRINGFDQLDHHKIKKVAEASEFSVTFEDCSSVYHESEVIPFLVKIEDNIRLTLSFIEVNSMKVTASFDLSISQRENVYFESISFVHTKTVAKEVTTACKSTKHLKYFKKSREIHSFALACCMKPIDSCTSLFIQHMQIQLSMWHEAKKERIKLSGFEKKINMTDVSLLWSKNLPVYLKSLAPVLAAEESDRSTATAKKISVGLQAGEEAPVQKEALQLKFKSEEGEDLKMMIMTGRDSCQNTQLESNLLTCGVATYWFDKAARISDRSKRRQGIFSGFTVAHVKIKEEAQAFFGFNFTQCQTLLHQTLHKAGRMQPFELSESLTAHPRTEFENFFFVQKEQLLGKSICDATMGDDQVIRSVLSETSKQLELDSMIALFEDKPHFIEKMTRKGRYHLWVPDFINLDFDFSTNIERGYMANCAISVGLLLEKALKSNMIQMQGYIELALPQILMSQRANEILPFLERARTEQAGGMLTQQSFYSCSFELQLYDRKLPLKSASQRTFIDDFSSENAFRAGVDMANRIISQDDSSQDKPFNVEHTFVNLSYCQIGEMLRNVSSGDATRGRSSFEMSNYFLSKMLAPQECLEFYEQETVQKLIDYQYYTFSERFFIMLSLGYMGLFIIPFMATLFVEDETTVFGCYAIGLVGQVLFFLYELVQISQDWRAYYREGFNIGDQAQFIVYLFILTTYVLDLEGYLALGNMVMVLLVLFKVFFFAKIESNYGFLVEMVYLSILDLRPFFAFFLLWILFFAVEFKIAGWDIQDNHETESLGSFFSYFVLAWQNSIGDIQLPQLASQSDSASAQIRLYALWVLWFANNFLMLIILLNFIIAVISQTYERVASKHSSFVYKDRAEMNLECQQILNHFGQSSQLSCVIFTYDKTRWAAGQAEASEWSSLAEGLKREVQSVYNRLSGDLASAKKNQEEAEKEMAALKRMVVEKEERTLAAISELRQDLAMMKINGRSSQE